VDKNPTWLGSWIVVGCPFHYREGYVGSPLKNVRQSASELDNLRKSIIKDYFEEYLGIDFKMKAVDLEIWILFI
jgi:hypothetical protein